MAVKVNRRFLPIKLLYFFFLGGLASLGPHVPIYLSDLGVRPIQLAFIFSAPAYLTVLCKPVLGIIADKMKNSNILIPILLLILIFSYLSLTFLPLLFHNSVSHSSQQLLLHQRSLTLYCHNYTALFITECSTSGERCLKSVFRNVTILTASQNSTGIISLPCMITSASLRESVSRCRRSELDEAGDGESDASRGFERSLCSDLVASDRNSPVLPLSYKFELSMIMSKLMKRMLGNTSRDAADADDDHLLDDDYSDDDGSPCSYYNIISSTRSGWKENEVKDYENSGLFCPDPLRYDITVVCYTPQPHHCGGDDEARVTDNITTTSPTPAPPDQDLFGSTFWLIFSIQFVARTAMASIFSLGDSVTLDILGARPQDFGKQRMWGTVGWGLSSIVTALLMQGGFVPTHEKHYEPAFYMCAALLFIAFIDSLFLSPVRSVERPELLRALGVVMRRVEMLVFLLSILAFGSLFGIYLTYFIIYISSLHAPPSLQGLALLTAAAAEIPLFFMSGYFIKKLGCMACISIGFLMWGVRFLGLSYIENPWLCLPIESLHGFCFAMIYSSMVSFAKASAHPGMSASIQSVVGSVFDVGIGCGSLLGGVLYGQYGGSRMYRYVGLASVATCILYPLTQSLISHRCPSPPTYHLPVEHTQATHTTEDTTFSKGDERATCPQAQPSDHQQPSDSDASPLHQQSDGDVALNRDAGGDKLEKKLAIEAALC